MFKVGIQGGGVKKAGELLRLLINHPDVEIKSIHDYKFAGRRISSVHHGLIGEKQLYFSENFELEEFDVIFLCDDDELYRKIISPDCNLQSKCCIIDLTNLRNQDYENYGMVYGLPEMNRKPLVRGALKATIPSPIASLVLIVILPLAENALLKNNLEISIHISDRQQISQEMLEFVAQEITQQLQFLQPSFSSRVILKTITQNYSRGMRMTVSINSSISLDDIRNIYETRFEDHNLTFTLSEPASIIEVEGTDKCLISLDKDAEGLLKIDAIADSHLRGGAGDAIHVMNLLCGLLERTGLALKVNAF